MSLPEFTTTRLLDAPQNIVWEAWTEPKFFGQWFGPKGFTSRVKTLELRPGGVLHSCLVSPEGYEMWAKFVYREVVPSSKLSWEHSFSDKDGNITRHPMHASWPLKLLTTITFEAQGEKTLLALKWTPLDATDIEIKTFADNMASMDQGWGGTFEQLTAFLAGLKGK